MLIYAEFKLEEELVVTGLIDVSHEIIGHVYV
jgi:hypothetical protein